MKDLVHDADAGFGQMETNPGPLVQQHKAGGEEPLIRTSIAGQVWFYWRAEKGENDEAPFYARSTWDTCKYPTPANLNSLVRNGNNEPEKWKAEAGHRKSAMRPAAEACMWKCVR